MPGDKKVYSLREIEEGVIDCSNKIFRCIHTEGKKLCSLANINFAYWEAQHVAAKIIIKKGHWQQCLFFVAGHLLSLNCQVCVRIAARVVEVSRVPTTLPRPTEDEEEAGGTRQLKRGRPVLDADGNTLFKLSTWLHVNRPGVYKKQSADSAGKSKLFCNICKVSFFRRTDGGPYFVLKHEKTDKHVERLAEPEGEGKPNKRLCVEEKPADVCNGFLFEDLTAHWWPEKLKLRVAEVLICL